VQNPSLVIDPAFCDLTKAISHRETPVVDRCQFRETLLAITTAVAQAEVSAAHDCASTIKPIHMDR
jgi:hypothetical protein